MSYYRLPLSLLLGGVSSAALLTGAMATAQVVSDRNLSQVSAQVANSCSVVTVEFNIRVQVVSYFPQTSGRELHIRVNPLDGRAIGRESLRPPEAVTALRSIEFDGDNASGPVLSLFFSRDVEFNVAPGSDPQTIIISLSEPGVNCNNTSTDSAVPPPAPTDSAAAPVAGTATPVAPRPGIAVPRGLYIINLSSQPDNIPALSEAQRTAMADLVVYETQYEREGRTWHRLRGGFYESRSAAEQARQRLVSLFPDAWVVAVSAQEREQGVGSRIDLGVAGTATNATATPITAAQPLTAEQQAAVTATMQSAEDALRTGDNDRAIALLSQLLTYPENDSSARALELLGLTRERKGQAAQARAEYDEYLRRFPTGEAADRVRQRLLALANPGEADTQTALRPADNAAVSTRSLWRWGARGSFSQFYFRDQSSTRFVDATRIDPTAEIDNEVNLNQLLTSADLTVTGGNDRTQLLARGSGSYTLNFRTGGRNVRAVTALYFDVNNQDTNLSARVGRQTRNGNGILGRFDGGYLSWQVQPRLRVNLATGFPVATSRQTYINTDRMFGGISLDYGNRADPVKATLYYFDQRSHGLIDRQAIGGELRYLQNNVNGFALVDYDIHFGRLNLGLATINFTLPDESSISVTADYRQSPLLTASNALIGQTLPGGVGAIGHLGNLNDYFSDSQIYQIARDNTVVSKSLTIAYSRRITANLQGNLDFALTNTGGSPGTVLVTAGSQPVAPQPAVGSEYFYGAQLIGNGLLFANDIYILSGRYADTQRARTYTFDINARVPILTNLRISPRVRYASRTDKLVDSSFSQIQPTLRVNFYPRRGSEVELEVGGNFSSQRTTMLAGTTRTTERGILLTIGYRLDF